jgi:plastocyanin
VERFNSSQKIKSEQIQKGKQMNRKRVCNFGFAVICLAIGVVARAQSLRINAQQEASHTMEVKIDNFSFGPGTLTVPVGTTVTWTNRDDIPHTVVSTEGAFKSKVLDTDEKFSFTFSKAGVYPYFCSIHPKMTGKVVVQ